MEFLQASVLLRELPSRGFLIVYSVMVTVSWDSQCVVPTCGLVFLVGNEANVFNSSIKSPQMQKRERKYSKMLGLQLKCKRPSSSFVIRPELWYLSSQYSWPVLHLRKDSSVRWGQTCASLQHPHNTSYQCMSHRGMFSSPWHYIEAF